MHRLQIVFTTCGNKLSLSIIKDIEYKNESTTFNKQNKV